MAKKKKEKEPYIAPAYIFCFEMYECFQIKSLKIQKKIEKQERKKNIGNTYRSYFLFCHTGVLFFVILHLCRSLYMYFFCKEGSA
jgi:hypothetical protein